MALVIDATKGVQTQTAECIVIGEILRPKRLVLLNKCDALQQDSIEKVKRKLQRTLRNTVFADCTIIPVSAAPVNGGDPYGMEPLISEVRASMVLSYIYSCFESICFSSFNLIVR